MKTLLIVDVQNDFLPGGSLEVKDGDKITINATKSVVDLDITETEMKNRAKSWQKPRPRYTRGVLAKYASTVSSASEGAVTDKDLDL